MGRVQRISTAALAGLLATLLWNAPGTAAGAEPGETGPGLRENPGKGIVLRDLRQAARCGSGYKIAHEHSGGAVHDHGCTHGPDQPPEGVDPKRRQPVLVASATPTPGTAAAATPVPCYGDGQSGTRVEAIYAYNSSSSTGRYSTVLSSIRAWAGEVDRVFNASASKTGGVRHVRFLTDGSCNLVVRNVGLPSTAMASIGATITELKKQGYSRSDRKYLIWADTNVYCGISQIMGDDRPGQENANNGSYGAMYSRVDTGCWGVPDHSVEAHELMHNFGGVQTTATHSTPANHCYDGADLMCYDDGSGVATQTVCGATHSNLFDCGQDDYFSTAAVPGTYLATHWNAANSAWLTSQAPSTTASWTAWALRGGPGGGLTSGIDATSWAAGRIDVVGRGAGDAVWHTWYDGQWRGWENLGGVVTADPATVSWGPNRLDIFGRGTDNQLWHRWWDNGWSHWEPLGAPPGGVVSGIDVASWAPGRIDVVVRGADNALWHKWYAGGWSHWESLGGILTADPSAVSWGNGRLDLFARGTDNALWRRAYQNGWAAWERIGAPSGGLSSGPDADSWGGGRLDVVAKGSDGAVWKVTYNGSWQAWESLGGVGVGNPTVVSWGSPRIDVMTGGTDRAVWHRAQG